MNRPPDNAADPPLYEPEEQPAYNTEICARITGVSTETLLHYREQGFIRPVDDSQNAFDDDALRTVRQIEHLRDTCGVNETGLRLILSLLDEVENLRASLQARH